MTDRPVPAAGRRVVPLAWAAFLLIGWTGVLVPSLLRQIEGRYAVDDAAVGGWYFLSSALYATASFAGGLLTERLGRRLVLSGAAALLALGLALAANAPSWTVFLLAAVPLGAGSGAIDGGINGLVLAVVRVGRGRALNLLHLMFAGGALTAPVVVGQLVGRGVAWEPILLVTALVAAGVGLLLVTIPMPSGRHTGVALGDDLAVASDADEPAAPLIERPVPPSFLVPLVLLAVAIGCYVAGEVGVSNWIVRFLDDVPVETATFGLSAFWAGLAVGRLVAARIADRFSHTTFAAAASVITGIATAIAVVAPSPELAIISFAIAGVASGPVFPMIVAIGGELYPDRLSATTGTLTGAAVIGGTIYPPLIGVMSARFGIGFGLMGAALLSVVCGLAVVLAARARSARIAQPVT